MTSPVTTAEEQSRVEVQKSMPSVPGALADDLKPGSMTAPLLTGDAAGTGAEPSGVDYANSEASSSMPVSLENYPLRLRLLASEESWIQVEVDGVEVKEAMLRPGESILWTATEQMELTIGNSGGLELTFNDEPLPLIGGLGQVARLRFTEEGLDGKIRLFRSEPPRPRTTPRPDELPSSALAF